MVSTVVTEPMLLGTISLVPSDLGGNEINNLHLINFDLRFMDADAVYSSSDKSCTVSCHNQGGTTPGYHSYE